MAYLILNHPEWLHSEAFCYQLYALIPDYLANSVGSLEKAGVGGSIPSLATIIPKDLMAESQNLPPKVPPKIITEFAP